MIQNFGQKSTAANLGLQHVKTIAIESSTRWRMQILAKKSVAHATTRNVHIFII